MKANYGRLEKKFKMDLTGASKMDWPTAGYSFEATPEGLLVQELHPPKE